MQLQLFQKGKEVVWDRVGLGENVPDARNASVPHELLAIVHRKHQHDSARSEDSNLPRGLKPIHDWHLKIQYHDIGM
jgi:hypothetical protein